MLTPTLTSATDVFKKLRWEQIRMIFELDLTNKADHLYNFCVTGLAVRDFLFAGGAPDQQFKDAVDKEPATKACFDIGNTSKHMILTKSVPTTKSVQTKEVPIVHVYQSEGGEILPIYDQEYPDVVIKLPDGTTCYGLDFTNRVVFFYQDIFTARGIPFDNRRV